MLVIPEFLIAILSRADAGRPVNDPMLSPLLGKLSGLPRTLIQVSCDAVSARIQTIISNVDRFDVLDTFYSLENRFHTDIGRGPYPFPIGLNFVCFLEFALLAQ